LLGQRRHVHAGSASASHFAQERLGLVELVVHQEHVRLWSMRPRFQCRAEVGGEGGADATPGTPRSTRTDGDPADDGAAAPLRGRLQRL